MVSVDNLNAAIFPLIAPLIVSLLAATVLVFWLNRYFISQTHRSWLGMSHSVTGWRRLFSIFEYRFAYKRKDIEKNLIRAGIYNSRVAMFYLPVKIALASIVVGSVLFFGNELGIDNRNDQLVYALLGMVVIIILPDIWLQKRQKKRIRRISLQLPYMIDLMAVCIQTGMTIEAAVAYLSEEFKSFDKDLAYILRQLDARARVVGITSALDEMLEQVPSNAMRSFVYTLTQSLQYGSSIFDVLIRLSANLREIDMLELEEKAGKLAAKMSVPLVLFIMFPIVILITAPGIMRLMSNG